MSDLSLRISHMGERVRDAVEGRGSASIPGRIIAPRIVFATCALGLTLFGLLMIYSASSIVGLTGEQYGFDPSYFLIKQLEFGAAGLLVAVVLACVDYQFWSGGWFIRAAWIVTVAMLVLVYTALAGHDAYGASRWIGIGPFTLQPSEFAKVTVVLVGARLAEEYFENHSLDDREALKYLALGIVAPLALVFFQPDKGTTGVIVATLAIMLYLAGVSGRSIGIFLVLGLIAAMAYALKDDYSRARILTMFDPFRDEFGDGYQLIQGFYALGSGGLTGVGIGFSRQKYNYLPMAHNDFIFAVIGEELGFVGAVIMILAFCALLWAGFKIAESAPDLTGRLIAAGCTSLLMIQLLLNVCGVIGIFPLSGKPVPFVSYGGSSIISSLMLVGLVMSVSLRAELPTTRYDERRSRLRLMDDHYEPNDMRDGSTAGRVTPRSVSLSEPRTTQTQTNPPKLRVVDGGSPRSVPLAGRVSVDKNGRRRIDLGPSAAERLRGRRDKK